MAFSELALPMCALELLGMQTEELLASISERLSELASGKQRLNWLHYFATLLPLVVILISASTALGWRLGELETDVRTIQRFHSEIGRCSEEDKREIHERISRYELQVQRQLMELRREMRAWHGFGILHNGSHEED